MTSQSEQDASVINGVEIGAERKTLSPQKKVAVFLERKRRRRLDLRTLHGTAREHAKVYRALAEGTITQVEAETRSRVLGRHKEILTSLEQRAQLQAIHDQLAALRAEPGFVVPAVEDKSGGISDENT